MRKTNNEGKGYILDGNRREMRVFHRTRGGTDGDRLVSLRGGRRFGKFAETNISVTTIDIYR